MSLPQSLIAAIFDCRSNPRLPQSPILAMCPGGDSHVNLMYNSGTYLLFPTRAIPALRDLRGQVWADLIEEVARTDPSDPQRLAFVLLMVRLAGCVDCRPDSFRALQGCANCARQTVREFQGSDQQLLILFYDAKQDVFDFIRKETN
jgi:hypothetical protein